MEQKHNNESQTIETTSAAIAANPLLNAVLSEDEQLVAMFGNEILQKPEEERRRLFSFYKAVSWLSDNKISFEFVQK